jgi:methylglutaconyl-CoA hydratase
MADLVLYESRPPAVVITMNRPDKRNALSHELIAGLTDAFRRASSDPAARAVVLTGAGTVFCAGMDLDEVRQSLTGDSDKVWDDANRLSALYQLIYSLPKPTIAAVNGSAIAGGAGLVTVCDLAVMATGAKFGYPEVRRGLVAAMVMPHLLRHVGERAARWLLLTGELIDAEGAFRHGAVNAAVPSVEVMPRAMEWCRSLAEGGPNSMVKTKELLNQCSHQAVPVADLAKASAEPRLSEECRGGLAAFFEKKPVPWSPGQ